MDHLVQDAFIRFAGRNRPAIDRVVMVDLDEQSLMAVGQWPWPRYRVAALVSALAEAEPAAIGLDIIFPEPDRTSLLNIRDTFQREFGLNITFGGVPPGLDDNDGYLGHTLARTRTVGASYLYFDLYNRNVECFPPGLRVTGKSEAISPPEASGVLCNTLKVQAGLTRCGFINTSVHGDGVLRRMQILVSYHGRWYPNLTLATIMQALGQESISIEADPFGPVVVVGEARIPVDETGSAVIAFPNHQLSAKRISAVSILTGETTPKAIKDKIVFVGTSAAGLNDLHHTPVGPDFPGGMAHVILTENALTGDTYRTPVWRAKYRGLTTLVAGLSVTVLLVFLGPGWAATGTALLSAIFPLAGAVLFFRQGVLLPMSSQLITMLLLFMLLSLILYSRERRLSYIRLKQFARARQTSLEAMAAVAETRDPETGGHIKRTQHYVKALATALAKNGKHTELTREFLELLFHSAPLHDVGKVGVPDHILLKPGELTPEEFEIMKRHTLYGKKIIENASRGQEDKGFFNLSGEIAYTHHEKWDGSGYPRGLSGEDIPLSGRLMALADVYDALISKRHYKKAFPLEESKKIIMKGRGSHFDPEVVDCFLALEHEFLQIAARFKDEAERSGENHRV